MLSLSINLYFYKKSLSMSIIAQRDSSQYNPDIPIEKSYKESLNSVYIMPHPPNFLDGRRLYFREYSIIESSGKSKIIFQEKIGNKWQATEVDSEAVRWK